MMATPRRSRRLALAPSPPHWGLGLFKSLWTGRAQYTLTLALCIGLNTCPAWSQVNTPAPEPMVSSLSLNGQVNLDLEMIQWPDGSISLPIKYLAGITDANPQQEHQTGAITFTDPTGGEPVRVDAGTQQITQGTSMFENLAHPLVMVDNGLFTERDIFVDRDLVEKLLNVSLSLNEKTQTMELSTSRELKVFLRVTNRTDGGDGTGQDRGQMPLVAPEESKQLVEKINLDFQTATYNQLQKQAVFGENKANTVQIFNMGSSLLTGVEGTLLGMSYELAPRWNMRQGVLGLQDLKWGIHRTWEDKKASLGSLMVGFSPLISPTLQVWGVQVASQNATNPIINPTVQRRFEGDAPGNGPLALEVNDQVIVTRKPIAGRYLFENVPLLPERVNRVRILQRTADGQDTVLLDKRVANFSKTLRQGERAFSTVVGKNPIRPDFVGENNTQWLMAQSNKWLLGGRAYYGLTDRLTLGVAGAGDVIFGNPRTNALTLLINQMDVPDLTGYAGYRRDPNFFSGASVGASLNYRITPRWSLAADVAGSNRNQYAAETLEKENAFGGASQLSANYEGKMLFAQAKVFRYGPNFYSPITLSDNNLFDRQGVSLTGNLRWLGCILQGGVEQYLTNMSGYFEGGKIAVNRWHTNLSRRLSATTDVRLSYNQLTGHNNERELNTQNMQVDVSQKLPFNLQGNVSYVRSTNTYFFNPQNPLALLPVDNQNTLNTFIQSSVFTPLPWRLGVLKVGNILSKEFNLVNIQGNLRFRHWLMEPLIQASVGGEQKLLTLGAGLFYEWNNGRRLGLRYNYTNTTLPSVLVGSSTNNAIHQFQVDFNDTLAVLGNSLLSVGRRGQTSGVLQGSVFLDLNQNGVQDDKEMGIPDIGVLVDGKATLKTNHKGQFSLTTLSPGVHAVNYDLENLSMNMTPTSKGANAHIVPGKRTQVALGIIVTPGSIEGTVVLKDANGTVLNPADLIVVLYNDQGKEVKFTYTDPQGRYSMSEIAPGTYTVKLDAAQGEKRNLQALTEAQTVKIPVEFEGFVEKTGVNFDVLQVFRSQ